MLIHRMTATFGKLAQDSLELSDGLNLLVAPNESGKSTWSAFLLSMLYGINSRERDRAGFIADKNRYAPWSGASMSGRIDCLVGSRELTITRSTRRANAPMGDFQAVFAGTGDSVPGMTGQNCGEVLLGVNREVFERSAFIRQAGLAITQDAGLERRISALISSGEEDTSYSEVQERLKKQLNRRRYNKNGQLPAVEAQLEELAQQLSKLNDLEDALQQAQDEIARLTEQEAALQTELLAWDRWDTRQKLRTLEAAEQEAQEAEDAVSALQEQLTQDHIPETDAIARLRGAIVNLGTVRKSVEKARAEQDDAMKALLRAEQAVNEHVFAGQTAKEAQRSAAELPKTVNWNTTPSRLTLLLGLLAAAGAGYGLYYATQQIPLAGGAAAAILLLAFLLSRSLKKKAIRTAQNAMLLKNFGTTDPDAIAAMAEDYAKLLDARENAQNEARAKSAAADSLYASLSSNEQAILLEIRRFAPSAFDLSTADSLLRSCATQRKELATAESNAKEARMRSDLLRQQMPALDIRTDSPDAPPERSRGAVSAELDGVHEALCTARSTADQLSGTMQALGDPLLLHTEAARLTQERQALSQEYDAISLAMRTLDQANTTLQSRFSPALGRKAAEIFRRLTADRYHSVVLDRTFHLSAEQTGEAVYRDAALLSAGTADQLYLATRLAICDLVLPADRSVPLVLDDALANFDDARCAAALDYLKEAAKTRQILLFTCHSREAAMLADDPTVFIQHLGAESPAYPISKC